MGKKQEKLKVSEIIIVEGKDDITALKRVVDAHIIALNGFSGISKKTIDRLIELSKKNEMIFFSTKKKKKSLCLQHIRMK